MSRLARALMALAGLSLVAVSSLPAQSWSRRSRNGRVYALVRPIRRPADGYRLMIFLHGQGGNETQGVATWKAEAARRGYVLACPASGSSRWVSAGEDLQWVARVTRDLQAEYDVPPERTLLVGHSAGGSAVLFYGIPHPELARAVVAVDAAMPLEVLPQLIRPAKPALLFLVGENDWNRKSSVQASLALKRQGYSVRTGIIPGAFHNWVHETLNPLILKWFEAVILGDGKATGAKVPVREGP